MATISFKMSPYTGLNDILWIQAPEYVSGVDDVICSNPMDNLTSWAVQNNPLHVTYDLLNGGLENV
jgi:hypothetical protein